MTDQFDRAAELEQMQRDTALQNRPVSVKSAVKFCVDCRAELPLIRQQMGACRCVTCQQIIEHRARGYRRW